jgi:hypothetical protein
MTDPTETLTIEGWDVKPIDPDWPLIEADDGFNITGEILG